MRLLEGRYRLEREIARGGMGRVFLALDERLRRQVAIKTLHEGASPSLQLRFVEEAQITGQLRHPNVIPVHELTASGNELFLAMQLIRGRELKQLIVELGEDSEARAKYPLNRRLRLFLKVCEAVAFAHDRSVIHRDLKPQNVMLGAGDAVLVMDWGVAKPIGGPESSALEHSVDSILRSGGDDEDEFSSQVTQRGAVVGTPAYMPLEQAEGAPDLDPRADVYALGSILYELLTYQPPYVGGATKVLRALFKGPPPPPRERAPELEIPKAVEAIALRAMARERDERYPTALKLADDVRAYLDDRAVGVYEEELREILQRAWRKHRGLLRGVVAGVAILAVAWVGALLAARAASQEARTQQAAAETARREAEDLAEEARRSMAAQRVGATASRLMREAYDVQTAFARRAGEVVAIDALLADFREAHAKLEAAQEQLASLEAEDAEALETYRASLADARAHLEQRCVGVLLARAPSTLAQVAEAGELQLTEVDRARILLRQGSPRGARALLEQAPASPARDALLAVAQDQDPAQRIPALEQAMRAHPEAAWPYLHRAEARLLAGQLEAAERDYLRARVLDPLDAWVVFSRLRWATPPYSNHVLIRNPLRVVTGESSEVGGETIRAGGLARELGPRMSAVTGLRRSASRFRNRWDGLDKQGERAGFAPKWERQLAEGQLPAEEGWQVLAEGALLYGEFAQARRYAQQGLEAFPDDRICAGLLANAQLELGELEPALESARAGLATHPWDPRLNYVCGEVLRRQGDHAAALPHLRLGVNGCLLSDRWERLAACLSELDDPAGWEEGILAAREALARDPFLENNLHPKFRPIAEDPQPHRTLAALRIRQGKLMLAAVHLDRARILAGFPSVIERVGKSGRDAKALAELHEDMRMLPAAVLYWRMAAEDPALAEEAKQRLTEAEAKLKR